MNTVQSFRAGDIVKYGEGPAEVLTVFPQDGLIFIMEKRNLRGHFVTPDRIEFIRRPNERHWSYRRKR